MKKIKYVPSFKIILFFLLVGSLIFSQQLYKDNRDLKMQLAELKKDPQIVAKEEAKALLGRLSSLVALPSGEEPVVATVTDKDKLKDQPIFANAENGDKLLIYALAKKAYLYDPINNKLKDIIPVNIGDQGVVAGAADTKTASGSATKKK